MKITNFSSIFNLQNIKSSFSDAYNSTRIAKVKALGYGLIGCTVLKSPKMTFNAYMYPKGWDLSEEEKEALKSIDKLNNGGVIQFNEFGKKTLKIIEKMPKSTKDVLFNKQLRNSFKETLLLLESADMLTINEHAPGMQKLYDRTAQLLPWPAYIKSLW